MADISDTMEPGNNAKVPHRRDRRKTIAMCVRINRWRKSLAYFADAQIFRDRRIKSPSVSPAETINPSCSPSHLRIKDRQTAQKNKTIDLLREQKWRAPAICVHKPENRRRVKIQGTETKYHQPTMRCVSI